ESGGNRWAALSDSAQGSDRERPARRGQSHRRKLITGVARTPFAPEAVLLREQLPANSVVGAPAPGAIGAIRIGRAARAVRTESGAPTGIATCQLRCRSTRPGCDWGNPHWACCARRSHRKRCSYRHSYLPTPL